MQTRIQKWGNSLGLRIPMRFAKRLQLSPGSLIILEIEDGQMIIYPPKYDLETMVQAITKKNQHQLTLEDEPCGNEEW